MGSSLVTTGCWSADVALPPGSNGVRPGRSSWLGPGDDDTAYINPDITLQLMRQPVGEWIGIDAGYHQPAHGFPQNQAVLYDDEGELGIVLQSLVESPRVMPLAEPAPEG